MKTVQITLELPDWAEWLAQDSDGKWLAFEGEPYVGNKEWGNGGHQWRIVAYSAPNPDWRSTLRHIK